MSARPATRVLARTASIGLALTLVLAPSGVVSAQSRFDERARTYMIEHCMEETAKRIEPGAMITVNLASGEMFKGSFVRASHDSLVVYPYGLLEPLADPLTIQKPLIKSLRFENKPYASNSLGFLGLVVGHLVGTGVAIGYVTSRDRDLGYGDLPLILSAGAVGSFVGFWWARNLTKDNPGESLIECQ